MGNIRVGTCAWADHEQFYPPGLKSGDRLAYYAQFFSIVEVDSTFYAIQPRRYFQTWAERTPDGFIFNVKAYGAMTKHHREPRPGDEDILEVFKRFDHAVEPLKEAGKLRALHFQFPPWFVARPEHVEWLHFCRDFFPRDLLAIEFRHRSWFANPERTEETLQLLRELDAAHVIVDEPQVGSGSIPQVMAVTNRRLAIIRFHGRNAQTWYIKGEKSADRFNYRYSMDELQGFASPVRSLAEEVDEVHLLMNNNRGNYAVHNALDLMQILGQPTPPRDERGMPVADAPSGRGRTGGTEQLKLF